MPEVKEEVAEKDMELVVSVDFVGASKLGEDGEIKLGGMSTYASGGFLGVDIGPTSIDLNQVAFAK